MRRMCVRSCSTPTTPFLHQRNYIHVRLRQWRNAYRSLPLQQNRQCWHTTQPYTSTCLLSKRHLSYGSNSNSRGRGSNVKRPPSAARIEGFFSSHGVEFDVVNDEYILKECPFCPPHKDDPSNLFKLSYNQPKDLFNCFRCQTHGKWSKLHPALVESSDYISPSSAAVASDSQHNATASYGATQRPSQSQSQSQNSVNKREVDEKLYLEKLFAVWEKYATQLFANNSKALLSYLTSERGITEEVLRRYGVGAKTHNFYRDTSAAGRLTMTFPQDLPSETAGGWQSIRMKLRSLAEKRLMTLEPSQGRTGFFGWRTVPAEATSVVLTEGEFDAMAVFQATGMPALSLPNGVSGLKEDLVRVLDRFERIYLWTDNDEPGRIGREKLVRKLGRRRCFVVLPRGEFDDVKDANAALLSGADLKRYLKQAKTLPHEGLMKLEDLKLDLLHEIKHPSIVPGAKLRVFPGLNALVKGLRLGELSILTGRTGVGKTTFASQLSLDICMSGVNTLWGSFEVDRLRFSIDMLHQYIGRTDPPFEYPSEDRIGQQELHQAASEFAKLPMFFLSYQGPTSANMVLDAMDHSVEVDGVQHIVLDNLQFMLGESAPSQVDALLSHLRSFATERNVHVTLVVHPRRESERFLLDVSGLPGSGKIIQEADNIFILQRYQDGSQSIQVKKNRYDGDIGEVPLKFMKSCKSYVDVSPLAEHKRMSKPSDIVEASEITDGVSTGD